MRERGMFDAESRGSVLVVEDSPTVAFVVGHELRQVGWKVQTARFAAHALDLVRREPFEVVVCDLHLPGMDGFGLLDQISEADPNVPVVMLSGDEGVGAILGAVRRGAFDYVVKSDDWTHLIASVERASKHRAIVRENVRLKADLEGHIAKLQEEIVVRRAAEQALALARDQAEAGSKAKSAFLANMSHELRTPLNAILGYAEMVGEDMVEAGEKEHAGDLDRIRGAGVHLLSLINDVLDLAKIESGKTAVHLHPVSLPKALQSIIDTSQVLAGANRNTLRLEIPDLPPLVTDTRKLQQCVLNLIGNACKFTQDGEVTVRVTEEVAAGRPWILVAVHDTGVGMTREQCQRVFDAFVQADETTTRQYGGTGLGLPITSRLAELLGGDLSVSSVLGDGSVFTLRFPADLAESPNLTSDQTTPQRGAVNGAVLIVDDDPSVHRLLGRYLRRANVEVLSAATGEQALVMAREYMPATILLDVLLPDIDGYEVLHRLKSDARLRHIPVVMSSVVDQPAVGGLGASGYLVKPIRRESLMRVLAEQGIRPTDGAVMIADDDLVHRRALSRMLEIDGWPYTVAQDGRQALELMQTRRPSLLLLDLAMPNVDGYEVLRQMNADPGLADVPVVVITGSDMSATQREFVAKRTVALVGKIEDPASMLDEVRRLLRQSLATGDAA